MTFMNHKSKNGQRESNSLLKQLTKNVCVCVVFALIPSCIFFSLLAEHFFHVRYYIGSNAFPDVLLNNIAGPDGDPLLLSLKLAVDVLVSHGDFSSFSLRDLNCIYKQLV